MKADLTTNSANQLAIYKYITPGPREGGGTEPNLRMELLAVMTLRNSFCGFSLWTSMGALVQMLRSCPPGGTLDWYPQSPVASMALIYVIYERFIYF